LVCARTCSPSDRSASAFSVFFLMIPPPPRSTLFPYTTLFRSCAEAGIAFDEVTVANDALTVVVNPDNPLACVTTDQLTQIYGPRSEEHTSELQSRENLVCRLLLEKKKTSTPPTSQMHSAPPSL